MESENDQGVQLVRGAFKACMEYEGLRRTSPFPNESEKHGGTLGTMSGSISMDLREERSQLQETVATVVMQIANGLTFLHKTGMIHGDLKPENILLKMPNNDQRHIEIRIRDLDDTVQMTRNNTSPCGTNHLRGTMQYLSPEMLKKFVTSNISEIPGRKNDMWILGCLLDDCVGGKEGKWLRKDAVRIKDGLHDRHEYKYIRKNTEVFVPMDDTISPSYAGGFRQYLRHMFPTGLTANVERWLSMKSAKKDAFIFSEIQQSKRERQSIALFHMDGDCSRISMQTFDPLLKIMREVHIPDDWPSGLVSDSFLALSGEVVFQVADAMEIGIKTIAWNFEKQVWRTISSDHALPALANAVAVGNRVYFWNNCDNKFYFKVVEIAGGKLTVIETLPKPKRIRHVNCHARYGNKIIYAGDISFRTLCSRKLEYFNIVTQKWVKLPNMPDERHGFAMIALLGNIYILGGISSANEMLRSCVRLNMKTRKWDIICDLLQPRRYHAAFVTNNCIHVYGGLVGPQGILSQTMEMYDTSRNVWLDVTFENLTDSLDGYGLLMSRAVSVSIPLTD